MIKIQEKASNNKASVKVQTKYVTHIVASVTTRVW